MSIFVEGAVDKTLLVNTVDIPGYIYLLTVFRRIKIASLYS